MLRSGGAGKVYFVLYLAVVLELLIIIVERDEAEEGLHQKQKETMRIVQSILSQLQSGAGTEGINTKPQDEITIPPAGVPVKDLLGIDIKSWRKYIVEVGVTDISASVKRKEGESEKDYFQRIKTLVKLSNVEQLEYQVFFNPDKTPGVTPNFPTDNDLLAQGIETFQDFTPGQKVTAPDGTEWEFLSLRKLELDNDATFNRLDMSNINPDDFRPVYPVEDELQIGPTFNPDKISADSVFYYNHELSLNAGHGTEKNKRAFVVHFQPPSEEGWYKLRFASKTNKILGVRGDYDVKELDDDETVNIGTVQLSVKELRKVHKALKSELEKYDLPLLEVLTKEKDLDKFEAGLRAASDKASTESKANDIQSKIKLYGYIAKLIAPGMSIHFDQNKGSIEFDIRVIKPNPPTADPVLAVADKLNSFDAVKPVFMFSASPYQGPGKNIINGYVTDENGAQVANVVATPYDQIASNVSEPAMGSERRYQATLDSKLPAGYYKLKLTHGIAGSANKAAESMVDLNIFETGLSSASLKDVNTKLDFMSYYGYKMIVNAEPASLGAIKPEEFSILVSTDAQTQPTSIPGLSVTLEDNIAYTPEAKEVTFSVIWNQPYSGEKVEIYPARTFALKQEEPNVNTNVSPEFSGTSSKIKVRVAGMTVTKPTSGAEGAVADVKVSALSTEIADGLSGYSVAVEPIIDQTGDGVYEMEFELSGKLPAGETKVRGTVNVTVRAIATNSINGVQSEPVTVVVPVRVDFEPDSRGGRRGGGARRRR